MRERVRVHPCAVAAAVGVVLVGAGAAAGSAFQGYGSGGFRAVAMPPTAVGSTGLAGDCLPDGRIVAVTGSGVYVESGAGTGVFAPVASFDPARSGGASDPAFVRVSPDGLRIAVGLGLGKPVAVVPVASLGTAAAPTVLTGALATYFDLAHTEGAWRNDGQLALTAGVFGLPSRVTLLEVGSNPGAPVNPTIITNIGGASAGVGFDGAGRLYTGNGFDLVVGGGQSQTGWIKAFEPALWAAGAADFEGSGVLIADVLSATDLVFDHEGNLAVGGGDFAAGDTGYLGLIEAGALAAAAMGGGGGGPVDLADAAAFKRLGPGGSPFDFYSAAFNPATGELHAALGDFASGANTWHATVPGPGGGAVLLIAGGLLGRRRAR